HDPASHPLRPHATSCHPLHRLRVLPQVSLRSGPGLHGRLHRPLGGSPVLHHPRYPAVVHRPLRPCRQDFPAALQLRGRHQAWFRCRSRRHYHLP
ncbi:hypothetical protein BN1708_020080, partial [Verticillium longisporum]